MDINKYFFVALIILAAISASFALVVVYAPDNLEKFGISGFATAGNVTTGKINLSVQTGVVINFTIDVVDWGSGRVDPGANNATLTTVGTTGQTKQTNGNWTGAYTNNSNGLIIENLGNVNVSLWLKTSANASAFIGGNNPVYRYNITNNETNSCLNTSSFNLGQWYDVNTSTVGEDGTKICANLSSVDSADTVRIDLLLSIPSSSKTGLLEDTITATAVSTAP